MHQFLVLDKQRNNSPVHHVWRGPYEVAGVRAWVCCNGCGVGGLLHTLPQHNVWTAMQPALPAAVSKQGLVLFTSITPHTCQAAPEQGTTLPTINTSLTPPSGSLTDRLLTLSIPISLNASLRVSHSTQTSAFARGNSTWTAQIGSICPQLVHIGLPGRPQFRRFSLTFRSV